MEAFTSCPEPALEGPSWLRKLELKLPGAGEGAKDEPRGPKDILEFDSARAPLAAPGKSPSLSKAVFEVVVL